MNSTYGVIELSGPGKFSEVRKPLLDPGPIQVRIRMLYPRKATSTLAHSVQVNEVADANRIQSNCSK